MESNINILVEEARTIVNGMLKSFCDKLIVEKQKECMELQKDLFFSDDELQKLQEDNSFSLTIAEYNDVTGTIFNEENISAKLCGDGKSHFLILSKIDSDSNVIYKSIDCSSEYSEELLVFAYNKYIQDNMKKKIMGALVDKYLKIIDPFYQFTKISYELREKQKQKEQQNTAQ